MPISPKKINGKPLVRIHGLTKRFVPTGRAALEQIDAEVHSGAVTGLVVTDLKGFTDRKAGLLSGAMKQKLGLACALISEPELLLLDEPGVGVDPISRRELWQMVQDLVRRNIGVVWSTAYLEEAELCNSVILLNEGKKQFDGPPKELTRRVGSRTFALAVTEGRRKVLSRALQLESVIDGVVAREWERGTMEALMATPVRIQELILGPI